MATVDQEGYKTIAVRFGKKETLPSWVPCTL
jgi:hypothetical protein